MRNNDCITLDFPAPVRPTMPTFLPAGIIALNSFSISGSDVIAGEVFDFETKSSYSIRVMTDDGFGGTFEKVFSIFIFYIMHI